MGITNSQYNTIMRRYEQQQLLNQQQLSDRCKEIYERFPEFSRLDGEIAAASTACARAILSGDVSVPPSDMKSADSSEQMRSIQETSDPQNASAAEDTPHPDASQNMTDRRGYIDLRSGRPSTTALRHYIHDLSAQKLQILTSAGYPKDYLELHYHCPDCQDTGYIGTQKCHCFRQAIIDLLYSQSNLSDFPGQASFSGFSLEYYSDQKTDSITGLTARQTAQRTLEECRNFVKNFDASFENLFLYGDTGLGKTFLSHCIARELLETAHSVIYFSAFRLFDLFADAAFGRTTEDAQSELEQHVFDCDLLIIDDLGTEMTNTFVSSQLFLILNERILRRKSTLISTNLNLGTFADIYSERVFSRISSSYTMLKLIGDDIRIQKKINRK